MKEALEVSVEKDESIVSLPKAAEICKKEGIGLSYSKLRRLVKTDKIPSFKIGNRYYLSMDVLRNAITDTSSPLWTK
ncbi:hypothetical protein R80B4_00054 [Fibrobacteres bacterium R8-0-B4]